MDDLGHEAQRATALLSGKTVGRLLRHRSSEVLLELTDGTQLFVDGDQAVELSITGPDNQLETDEADPRSATGRETRSAELLSPPHNYAVVQLPDRRFPGVVFQGDSLFNICERLAKSADGDLEELADVRAELDDVLDSYIAILEQRSIGLPFFKNAPE